MRVGRLVAELLDRLHQYASRDVVARTDLLRRVLVVVVRNGGSSTSGQGVDEDRRRRQEGRRRHVEARLGLEALIELRVVGGVADEDSAEQDVRLFVDDELPVHLRRGIVPDELHLGGVVLGLLRHPERRHVAPEELELRRHVGAEEHLGLFLLFVLQESEVAEDVVGGDCGLLVARGDEAVDLAAVEGDLADGVDRVVGGAHRVVDEDAAALVDVQVGIFCDFVSWANAGGDDDHTDVEGIPAVVGELDGRHGALVVGAEL
mmetsp:Transcript_2359/g.7957  ORF Transcript_2359/g.7957 Transcript_2359/m.7957 type:complete len:262 (+) Transcript_2359:681-1466(+)